MDPRRGGTSVAARRRVSPAAIAIGGTPAVAVAAGVWWIARDRTTADANAGAADFALAVCDAVVRGDEDAYVALHVRRGDLSLDGDAEWVAFAGGSHRDFDAWEERVRDTFRALQGELDEDAGDVDIVCAEVTDIESATDADGPERGRVIQMSVRLEGDPVRSLLLGSSIVTRRGRVFQGEREGAFARFEDQPETEAQPERRAEAPVAGFTGDVVNVAAPHGGSARTGGRDGSGHARRRGGGGGDARRRGRGGTGRRRPDR